MKNIFVGPILIFIYYLCLSVAISHCTNMKLKYAYLFINSNNSHPSTIDLLVKMIVLFHIIPMFVTLFFFLIDTARK